MAESFSSRFKNAWNAFMNRDSPSRVYYDVGSGSSYRPDRVRLKPKNERSIITTVYNRIAIDCASVNMQHIKADKNGRFIEVVKSGLNNCLTLEANIDQTGRALIQDIVMSMFDEGCVAVVPTDTDIDPITREAFDILELRTGKVTEWYPEHVQVYVYNERKGMKETITVPKSTVALIENPLYSIMNEPNSTMQRLIRKLSLLDVVDEQSGSGKLDMIIQLPYIIKTEARRQQAEMRRKDIEMQLASSKYGIAYTDGTEKITQLNRPLENNLMSQVEYLTNLLYSQLGITTDILNGTANEQVMLNYNNRTIEPILSAIADEFNRKFLTKTGRTQGQKIYYFSDPFKLVPVQQLADIADKFTRNEIMSSNEIRQIVGMHPVDDPSADQLRNKNINATPDQQFASTIEGEGAPDETATEEGYAIPEDQSVKEVPPEEQPAEQVNEESFVNSIAGLSVAELLQARGYM